MNLGVLYVIVYNRKSLLVVMVSVVLCSELGTAGVRYSRQTCIVQFMSEMGTVTKKLFSLVAWLFSLAIVFAHRCVSL